MLEESKNPKFVPTKPNERQRKAKADDEANGSDRPHDLSHLSYLQANKTTQIHLLNSPIIHFRLHIIILLK